MDFKGATSMEKFIEIDPKMFILEPYSSCPKCKKASCFGVLSVGGNRYTKRCRECWFTETRILPPLNKKIIYLDQFAISDMMKFVNTKLGKKPRVDEFWAVLFEKLGTLTKLQLVVCPSSSFHEKESLLYEYKSLRRMYKHLSHGVIFYNPRAIREIQLESHFNSIVANDRQGTAITVNNIIYGGINSWSDRSHISINHQIPEEEIESMRQSRSKSHEALSELFEIWKLEKDKEFNDYYAEEVMIWGETTTIINSLISCIPNYEENYSESQKMVIQYLKSKGVFRVPFIKICSLLWACIRHKAAHGGMKKPPNKGMVNDIEMIASLLPYCDAMYIDKGMAELLNHGEVKKGIAEYRTKIFSKVNKNDFLKFLDDIKDNASKEHMETVKEVYGEGWLTPFWSMYEHD
jgi:hypothetical protein